MTSFCNAAKSSHIFQQNISVYALFNDQSFNDIVSFEQLDPDVLTVYTWIFITVHVLDGVLIRPYIPTFKANV